MSTAIIGPNGKRYIGVDPEVVEHFVYRMHAEDGEVLNVGLSKNVPARIKAHVRDAERGNELKLRWLPQVRTLSMEGPFKWLDAVERERSEIERLQPIGNRQYTKAYGWRPRHEAHNPFSAAAHSP